MMVPTVGSTAAQLMARPFLFHLLARAAVAMMSSIWITPNGMLKRIAFDWFS